MTQSKRNNRPLYSSCRRGISLTRVSLAYIRFRRHFSTVILWTVLFESAFTTIDEVHACVQSHYSQSVRPVRIPLIWTLLQYLYGPLKMIMILTVAQNSCIKNTMTKNGKRLIRSSSFRRFSIYHNKSHSIGSFISIPLSYRFTAKVRFQINMRSIQNSDHIEDIPAIHLKTIMNTHFQWYFFYASGLVANTKYFSSSDAYKCIVAFWTWKFWFRFRFRCHSKCNA